MTTVPETYQRSGQPSGRLGKWWRVIKGFPPVLHISGIIVLIFILLAVFGPVVAPYDYTEMHLEDRLKPPSSKYLLGTDQFGRDLLSRMLVGARDIVTLAGVGTAAAVLLGTVIGLYSGYWGGLLDEIVMRLLDAFFSIPALLFALLMVGMIGPSRLGILVVIATRYSAMVVRVVRSVVLETKGLEYVEAAKMRGESTLYTVFREILPAVVPALVVETCMRFAYSIFLVASLGFLGLGLQPPTPDWGMMVVESQAFMKPAPWMTLVPATAVATLVISVNLLSDALSTVLQYRATGEER